MTTQPEFRQYAVLKKTEDLALRYRSFVELTVLTIDLLQKMGASSQLLTGGFRVAAAPSLDWKWEIVQFGDSPPDPEELIISYAFTDPYLLIEFRDLVLKFQDRDKLPDGSDNLFLAIGADVGGDRADHWCPGTVNRAMFGDRAEAHRVLNADVLSQNQLRGRRVNVVIVDEGLDRNAIPAANWGGGLISLGPPIVRPGSAPRTSHGMLIASNVLDIAPDAVLYDVPMIPARITNIPVFTNTAHWIYLLMLALIGVLRGFPRWSGPWILVNAWAIFDRSSELPTLGDYTENTHPGGHPFNNVVGQAVEQHNIDVVFAAGNCGQFCPSERCGKLDRGPAHSIWGANAHFAVITAGAARTDELWLGYSSQGPGPSLLGPPGQPPPNQNQKPDFCAPSQFKETTDADVEYDPEIIPPTLHPRTNTGTSTACALTAGVVAALRSNPKWDQVTVTPDALKQRLIETTHQTKGPGWNPRLGWGVLDAGAAFDQLSIDFP
jgi:Subtilase family